MNVLISTLDLIGLPEPDRRRLLSNLRDAEAAAVRTRAAEQRKAHPQRQETPSTNSQNPQLPTFMSPRGADPFFL